MKVSLFYWTLLASVWPLLALSELPESEYLVPIKFNETLYAFSFHGNEVADYIAFFVKCAAFCTHLGLFKGDVRCAKTLFDHASYLTSSMSTNISLNANEILSKHKSSVDQQFEASFGLKSHHILEPSILNRSFYGKEVVYSENGVALKHYNKASLDEESLASLLSTSSGCFYDLAIIKHRQQQQLAGTAPSMLKPACLDAALSWDPSLSVSLFIQSIESDRRQFDSSLETHSNNPAVERRIEWVDLQLCMHFMKYVSISRHQVPIPVPADVAHQVLGMHTEDEANSFRCTGSMQSSLPWRAHFWMKPWPWQHFPLFQHNLDIIHEDEVAYEVEDEVKGRVEEEVDPVLHGADRGRARGSGRVGTHSVSKPLLVKAAVISVYDVFTFVNVAHTVDSGELFWSTAAAATHLHPTIAPHISGVLLLSLWHEDATSVNGATAFAQLFYRTIVRYCLDHRLTVYVNDLARVRHVVDSGFSAAILTADLPALSVVALNEMDSADDVVFSTVIDRPMHNVLTPDGAALMQSRMISECSLSDPSSPQHLDALASRTEGSPHVGTGYATVVRQVVLHTKLAILATRAGARHLSNVADVLQVMRDIILTAPQYRDISVTVIIVDFSKLSPCEQIDLMSRAAVFVFVHGAEGAMISFLQPGAVVVEMHPAGCCVADFNSPVDYQEYYKADALAVSAYYHFYSGTLASSWLCDSWMNHLMVSPYCGTTVIMHQFSKMLRQVLQVVR